MKNHSFIFFCYNGCMKKIIITQMLIAIIITMFDKACEIILKGPCVWDIQDVVAFIILDTVLIIKQMNYL